MGSKQKVKEGKAKGFKPEQARGDSQAEVVEILGRVGTKQCGMQVRCKILDGRDADKIMRRNVMGPVRVGDILILRETEIEAAQMRGKR